MTNMATMPIYGKNLKKSSPEPIYRWPWNFVCSIVYASTIKVFKLWPWIDLDLFSIKVKFGYIGFCMGESEFLCPRDDSQGALRFAPVCPSVCLSVLLSVRPFVTLYGIEFV